MNYEQRIIELIKSDELRMRALRAAKSLALKGGRALKSREKRVRVLDLAFNNSRNKIRKA